MIGQINQEINKRFYSGSPITGILQFEVKRDPEYNVYTEQTIIDVIIGLLKCGLIINNREHKINFEKYGDYYVTCSSYTNQMKLYIIDFAVEQAKRAFDENTSVEYLLSKPANGWV